MKKFSELKVGDEFHSTCSISEDELDSYLAFSRVRNALMDFAKKKERFVSGRAILSRMEGEFTRLGQIYGNQILHVGTDGDPDWEGRCTRFLRPLAVDEVLNIRFRLTDKRDDGEYGRIAVDFEGTNRDGETIVVSKRNLYRMKKEP